MQIKQICANTWDPLYRNPAYASPRLILGQNPFGTPLMFRTYFLYGPNMVPAPASASPKGERFVPKGASIGRAIVFGVAYFYVLQRVEKVKSLKAESKQ